MSGRADAEPSDRRSEIIEAAIRQLNGAGLSGFSARSVAAAGGLPKSAVHYYFADMNELLDEAEAEIARRYFSRVKAAAEARMDPLERFWHAVDVYYRPFGDNLTMTSQWLEYWIDATRRGRGASVERIQGEFTMLFALLLEPLGVSNAAGRARALTSYFIGALMRQMTSPIEMVEHRAAITDLCGLTEDRRVQKPALAVPPAPERLRWTGSDPARLEPVREGLSVTRTSGISTILFDRPARANALTGEILASFAAALEAIGDEDDSCAVVLRGAGERVFVSGSDLAEIHEQTPEAYAKGLYAKSGVPQMIALDKPTIAAINGDCIGGGIMLAIAADMRIAVSSAMFATPVGLLGAAFPVESVDRLVQLVGAGQASRLLQTGVRIDAAEALRIGLVEQVVDRDRFDAAIAAAAGAIATMSRVSVKANKAAIQAAQAPHLRAAAQGSFEDAWGSLDTRKRIESALRKMTAQNPPKGS